MDCYFHNAVPSVGVCADCKTSICKTCRDARGLCPSCRLDERINAASARERVSGPQGPSNPPPGPASPSAGNQPYQQWWTSAAPARTVSTGVVSRMSPETRALVAAGYPLWPLAGIALLGPRTQSNVRRAATQAIAFNFSFWALWFALGAVSHIPMMGLAAFPLLGLLVPTWLVASVVYGWKTWNGEEVRVPIIADWLDERERNASAATAATQTAGSRP